MRLIIVGAGSLGLLFAGRLARVFPQVLVICRGDEQARAIRKQGITVRGLDGTSAVVAIEAASFNESLARCGEDDWVLLTVKQAHLTEPLLGWLQRLLGDAGTLLCMQNGIGHLERLGERISAEKICAAVTTEGARKSSLCEVAHTGQGTTWLGFFGTGSRLKEAESEKKLVHLLQQAGFSAHLSNNMEGRIWDKLLINAAVNPLTAILRVKNGQLLSNPHALWMLETLFAESRALAQSLDIPLSDDLWYRLLEVCRQTADNTSSMLQDVLAGQPTEIDAINGQLVRLAGQCGHPLPAHSLIYQMVKAMEG